MSTNTRREGQEQGQSPAAATVAPDWIEYDHQRHNETGSAVYAWDAIHEALSTGLELPEWTKVYLLRVASSISQLSRDDIPRAGKIDAAVAKAVELQGGAKRNPFTAPARVAHDLGLAVEVYSHHSKNWARQREGLTGEGTHDWHTVFGEVAQGHLRTCPTCKKMSKSTVKRAWYKHALTVIPPHLVKRSQSQKIDDILR